MRKVGNLHLWLIRSIGLIVPRRLRADWRQEWEAELQYREEMLAEWERLTWRNKLDLMRRSASAFWDAMVLQPKRWEDEMMQDIRYGIRLMLKHKGFTLIAIFTLALGIGVNTSVFSLINAVLLRPLTADAPERLARVYDGRAISYPAYADYRDQCTAFAGLAAYASRTMGLRSGERSEPLAAEVVTGNYFEVLGGRAAIGRTFLPVEDQASSASPVVVISHALWQHAFNGAPEAVGQSLTLNGQAFTVIGVMPNEFASANTGFTPALWVTVRQYSQLSNRKLAESRDDRWLSMIARLSPGVGLAQGEAAANLTARHIAQAHPETKSNDGQKAVTLVAAQGLAIAPGDQVTVFSAAGLLTVIAGLILIVACANVTSMLLARAVTRRREIAVRLALGSTRWRLIRQLLTEGLLLALLGGAGGLLLACWTPGLLLSLLPPDYHAPILDTRLDLRVFGFTFGVSLLTSALFGLLPALQASKPDLLTTLKDEQALTGRLRTRLSLRSSLVVAQVAISLVLLVVAGLFVRNFRRALIADPGFAAQEVLAVPLDLKLSGYDAARSQTFYDELLSRIRALPQVRSASLAAYVPLTGGADRRGLKVEGYTPSSEDDALLDSNTVGPGYFQTMGIPLLRGREFTAQDVANEAHTVIINEAFARKFWPQREAVGQRLRLSDDAPALEVIGIIKNSKYLRPEEIAVPFLYEPLLKASHTDLSLLIRTTGHPSLVLNDITQTVLSLDKTLSVFPRVLAEQLATATAPARMSALLAIGFGLLALCLTVMGVYGLMSYVVTQRTHEVGIRLALGAQRFDVLRLIVRDGMRLVLLGAIIGLAAAFLLTRLLSSFLFGISVTDALTFGSVAMLLLLAGAVACYLPARRAAKVDPLVALRHD